MAGTARGPRGVLYCSSIAPLLFLYCSSIVPLLFLYFSPFFPLLRTVGSAGISTPLRTPRSVPYHRRPKLGRRSKASLARQITCLLHREFGYAHRLLAPASRPPELTKVAGCLGNLPDSFIEDNIRTVDMNGCDAEGNFFEITRSLDFCSQKPCDDFVQPVGFI